MKYKCFVFDLDGTIYFGDKLADKANEVILKARGSSYFVMFVTNNSAKTRQEIHKRLINMGIDVKLNEVITSSYVIAKYLNDNNLKNIYCIGTNSLKKEIENYGIKFSTKDIETIVVGYNKDFKLDDLTELLNMNILPNAKIIAANKERTYPSKNHIILAGAGPIVASIEQALNKNTDLIIGKPNKIMLETMLNGLDIEPKEVCVIGDSFESDIKMAQDYGADSILITDKEYKGVRTIQKLGELLEIIE